MSPGVVETGGGVWVRRKVFHMAVGCVLILSMMYSNQARWFFLAVLGAGLVLGLWMEKRPIRVVAWFLSRYDKTTDLVPGQGPITFFTGTLVAWFLFGGEMAVPGVVALTFGDPMAYIFGRSIGGPLLPWSGRKTVAGTLAFSVFSGIVSSLIWGPVAGVLVGVTGAAAESLPLQNRLLLDDNIIIPVAVSSALWVASLIGPSVL